MSTRAKVASAVASAGLLLTGCQAATSNRTTTASDSPGMASVSPSAEPSTASPVETTDPEPGSSEPTGNASSQYADGTFAGAPSANRYGSWTVTVTILDGRITDVTASSTASDSRSQSIGDQAVPELRAAVLDAQSAQIDTVSGATMTSRSYLESLQSALDQARA